MSDIEFKATVIAWLAARNKTYFLRNRQDAISRERAKHPRPKVIFALSDMQPYYDIHQRLDEEAVPITSQLRVASEEAEVLEKKIRQYLPEGIWFILDGQAILHHSNCAIQVKDAEEVLDEAGEG